MLYTYTCLVWHNIYYDILRGVLCYNISYDILLGIVMIVALLSEVFKSKPTPGIWPLVVVEKYKVFFAG